MAMKQEYVMGRGQGKGRVSFELDYKMKNRSSKISLCQPYGFIFQPHIDPDVAFRVLLNDDFAGVHLLFIIELIFSNYRRIIDNLFR